VQARLAQLRIGKENAVFVYLFGERVKKSAVFFTRMIRYV